MTGEKWGSSNTADYSYNQIDQLTQMVDLTTNTQENYAYDAAGRLQQITPPAALFSRSPRMPPGYP